MRWTRRRSLGALAAIAASSLAVAVATGGGAASAGAAGSISFGEVWDFTGVGAGPTPYANASILSAEYDINAAGGVLGQHVNNVPIDTKSDPADGVLSLNRALAVNHIVVEQGPSTLQASALVPILQRAKVITLCGCGNPQFDRTTDPYFWRFIPPDPVGGETMAIDAKQLGYTRIAAVFGTDAGSQGDLPGVLGGVKAAKLKLVANIGLTPDQTSYRTQVEQLIGAKPQVIFTETDGPTAATFFGELKQLGTLTPVFGTNATLQTPYLKALGRGDRHVQPREGLPGSGDGAVTGGVEGGAAGGCRLQQRHPPYCEPPPIAGVAVAQQLVRRGQLRRGDHRGARDGRCEIDGSVGRERLDRQDLFTGPRQDGRLHLPAGRRGAQGGQADPVRRRVRPDQVRSLAQLVRRSGDGEGHTSGNVVSVKIFKASEIQKLG